MKYSIIPLFVLSFLFFSTHTFAQENTTPQILAEINIAEARIIERVGNTVGVALVFSNGKGVQTDVRYSIDAVKEGKVYSTTVFEDVLVLSQNSTLQKNIVYTIPTLPTGKYELRFFSANTEGFPFGFSRLGEVTVASPLGVSFIPDSCAFSRGEGKGKKVLGGAELLALSPKEKVEVSCTTINTTPNALPVTFSTHIKKESIYGSATAHTTSDVVILKSKETKILTGSIEIPEVAGKYVVEFTLSQGENETTTLYKTIAISGSGGVLRNVSLDKDGYAREDVAQIQVVWSASVQQSSADVVVKNNNGFICGSLSSPLTKKAETLSIPIKITCTNPSVSVTLKDQAGNILDKKITEVQTVNPLQEGPLGGTRGMWVLIGGILLIAGIGIYIKRKKHSDSFISNTNTF